jgi:hypothetical protein
MEIRYSEHMLITTEIATSNCHQSIALPARLTQLQLEMEMEGVLDTLLAAGDIQFRHVDVDLSFAAHGNGDVLVE